MAQEIHVPEVSDGVTEGTVIALNVAEGDSVEADQTLLEMETDKAVVAIPAPFSGTITRVDVAEGDKVKVGQAIMAGEPGGDGEKKDDEKDESDGDENGDDEKARDAEKDKEDKDEAEDQDDKVDKEDKDDKDEKDKDATAEDEARSSESESEPEPESKRETEKSDESESRLPPAPTPPPPPASTVDLAAVRQGDQVAPAAPSVRRLARELGADIYQVQGTGPAGRISENDVRTFVRETMQRLTGGGPDPRATGEFPGLHAQRPLPDFTKWGPVSQESLSRVRELTADAMSYAWSTIPMVTQYDHAAITGLEAFRKEYNAGNRGDAKLTMTALLVKVCAAALKAFPRFNSSLDLARKELILKHSIHIGVAVDTPGGLLVPVIRDADSKGIEKLAAELNETAEKTRERKISPADMEGGTFTISNLGGIGGTAFTPIVYAPQVAILGVSRSEMRPVWNGTEFEPELVMPLSLTYDHRVIDGADGARFLRWICEAIERPIHLAM